MVDVGNRIKELRMSQKITQSEFAIRLGVTKSAISSYENGSRLFYQNVLHQIPCLTQIMRADLKLEIEVEK